MTKIGIGDWVLARSDGFRFLMNKFRDHKIKTENSFGKIKNVHRRYEVSMVEMRKRVDVLELAMNDMQESAKIRFIKKRK